MALKFAFPKQFGCLSLKSPLCSQSVYPFLTCHTSMLGSPPRPSRLSSETKLALAKLCANLPGRKTAVVSEIHFILIFGKAL